MKIQSYENLIVWQKSMELVIFVYQLTQAFPREELYGLTSQMRRSAVSIPSNIADGSRRGTKKDFRHFVIISFGSGAELETQLKIAKRLKFGKETDYLKVENLLNEIMRMLNKLANGLES